MTTDTKPAMPTRLKLDPATVLTNSRIQAYASCPRRHYLRYELGISPQVDARVLRFGTCVHKALDNVRRGMDEGMALEDAISYFITEDFADHEQVRALVEGYWRRWRPESWTVIQSEMIFEVPIINPASGAAARIFTLAGKSDVIVKLDDGRTAVVEHKTTCDDLAPDSDYWKRLRIDSQISLYVLGAWQLGYRVDTVVYDVLHRPLLEPLAVPLTDADGVKIVLGPEGWRVRTKDGKKWRETSDSAQGYVLQTRPMTAAEYKARLEGDIAQRPEYYYARREIARLPADLEEARMDLYHMAKLIRESQLNRYWPRNTSACRGFGRCPFFELCTGGYDVNSGEVPEGYELVKDLHPELMGE